MLYVVFCFAHFPTRSILQDPRKVSGILDEGCVKETGLPVKETKLHMDFSAFSESNFVFVMIFEFSKIHVEGGPNRNVYPPATIQINKNATRTKIRPKTRIRGAKKSWD